MMKIGSPQPNAVLGYWEYQYEVTANIQETNLLSWGTNKTAAETQTSLWSASITASVESGFDIMGNKVRGTVNGTLATKYGQQYSQTWSMNQEQTFNISFLSDQIGEVLGVWQWKFYINDSFGNQLTSASQQYALTKKGGGGTVQAPKCQPGYNTDEYYQVCEPEYYLPALNPQSTRRNLRRAGFPSLNEQR
jgi:CEL-III C-terminal